MDDLQAMLTAQADQAAAEIDDTAGQVGRHFERLIASGIPEAQAAMMTSTFNAMLLARHFGIEMYAVPGDFEGVDE